MKREVSSQMGNPKSTALFFAGTDTDVGKTYTASLAAKHFASRGLRVGVYKPVASGCRCENGVRIADDAASLWHAAGQPRTPDEVCPQKFLAPLAPPEAAKLENCFVDDEQLLAGLLPWLGSDFDVTIIEGAGGLMSPLSTELLNVDLINRMSDLISEQFPQTHFATIVVAANRLGVIHQTLATLAAAASRDLQVEGVILSHPTPTCDSSAASNAAQIARFSDAKILGEVRHGATHQDLSFLTA
ncbi:dethiobiotin synthase [Rubripirellula amarantea]|uniref:ATP-dependent dethiobiotin synthetase BioD n=1 Tax=Rubripirellula amarantea TaxID=2527999 RepID=A0A5C5WR83_9BACT|nr:dethiobiotin synthase [Rubripirellula amarantea]MDA8745828.1 dethiobiotin synthase [Rubripirellula amarantea]TWT52621.1 ATP-dependent dethiobiotin synthetase BioD [Rubripirellula amarantea]